jgi:lysozyme
MKLKYEINKNGILLLQHFEQCRLKAYPDSNGTWTIGWGHTAGVYQGMSITQEKADFLFVQDLEWAENAINKYVTVDINSNQFSALVAFVFNIGEPQFKTSTLLRWLNQKKYFEASQQFKEWRKETINGKKQESKGLFRRRISERNLFNSYPNFIVLNLPSSWKSNINTL